MATRASRLLLPLILLVSPISGPALAAGPEDSPVIEGRVTVPEGRPITGGVVAFGRAIPGSLFFQPSSAKIEADGSFRLQLPVTQQKNQPASNTIRYQVLVPIYRAASGTYTPGAASPKLEVPLQPEPWLETTLQITDQDKKPLPGVTVSVLASPGIKWADLSTGPDGVCRVEMAVGVPLQLQLRAQGFVSASLSIRSNKDELRSVRISLPRPIRGQVVDPDGKPIDGVQVGSSVGPNYNGPGGFFSPDGMIVAGLNGRSPAQVTSGDGHFRLSPTVNFSLARATRDGELIASSLGICCVDRDFRRFAFFLEDWKSTSGERRIVLAPSRLVRIPVHHAVETRDSKFLESWQIHLMDGQNPSTLSVMYGLMKKRVAAGSERSSSWIEAPIPAGHYQLRCSVANPYRSSSEAIETATVDLVIPPGDRPIELPPVRLSAAHGSRLAGKPAPEIRAKDLHTGKPVRLADFRGKVVVLDFWGYWCGVCIAGFPKLEKLQEAFKNQNVKFLAIHDQSVQSREEYERKFRGVIDQRRGKRDLALQVVYDEPEPLEEGEAREGRGQTCSLYQIKYFPTLYVIGPDGVVIGTVNHSEPEKLEAMIRGALR